MAKTMICHCEDVPESEIREAVRAGYRDLESLKRYLAIGTGACQSKSCVAHIAKILESESGASQNGAAPYVSRPPIYLTPLGHFAGVDTKARRDES
ncbi:MAG: (2Fe-2S)-binding protein [Deltaproteobacteria bacterium]|nr:(2Fe-2S)-binding protein [Deltaproteobacteria bacterium]